MMAHLALLGALVAAAPAHADERGLEVVRQADAAARGYQGEQVDLEIEVRDARDRVRRFRLLLHTIEVPDAGERMRIEVKAPADLRGTRALFVTHPEKGDDVWFYDPTGGAVKRVSARGRTRPFLGTEFAYEDILPSGLTQFTYAHQGEVRVADRDVIVVERRAAGVPSAYARQLVYYDREHLTVVKIESFDARERLAKVVTYSQFARFGGYWRPQHVHAHNARTERSTTVRASGIVVGEPYPPSMFDPATMKD